MTLALSSLRALVTEAQSLAGDHPCDALGHDWRMEGGRPCPHGHEGCSQLVFRCARCPQYDYGEPGGPGAEDCAGRQCNGVGEEVGGG